MKNLIYNSQSSFLSTNLIIAPKSFYISFIILVIGSTSIVLTKKGQVAKNTTCPFKFGNEINLVGRTLCNATKKEYGAATLTEP
jgi:hypothetical protein